MNYLFKPLYDDTDSARANHTKTLLNGMYGLQVNKYCEADVMATKETCEKLNKEGKQMNRDYIVVHMSNGGKAFIIFKEAIDAIIPANNENSDYKTEIHTRGSGFLVSDSYESVVKQMFK